MSELCFAGWKVEKSEAIPIYHDFFDAFQYQANAFAIADRMEKAYQARGDNALREKAREGALPYDADTVTEEYWKPILKEMEEIVKQKKTTFESAVSVE